MITLQKITFIIVAVISLISCSHENLYPTTVVQEGSRTYIIDQTGYKWDITEAKSIGFKPERFQYGMGKDAFSTLDATGLSDDKKSVPDDLRVIGIEEGASSQAYSVQKLRGHEIANSAIGSKPIAVGY
ncbi:MAG: DUF3179 domain-containing protein [Nitrospira sp.]|nr:DUF3179 domain-containing protein [bacterium]MBL7048336.1 DUF3179 domain-containing protein [Nitrospira sp.]